MNVRASLLLAALACAGPVAAQNPPEPRHLLQVVSSPAGIVLSVDSFSIGRTGDSTFVVDAVYQFPRDTARRVPDRREEMQEMDCARSRLRGRRTAYFIGDGAEPVALDPTPPSETWQRVPDEELLLFEAICSFLLGGFAAGLPLLVEEQPELLNREAVQRALSRAYPPLLRDDGRSGTVVIRFRVLTDGTVDPATVEVVSTTHAGFSAAAFRVALTMRFRPARFNGTPIPVWISVPVTFFTMGPEPEVEPRPFPPRP
ncbi:MAG TPA: energy transducer TonB [Longimicrobium sp.]|jgi:TonB family protein|nr:energy transducer TonB [Longimicrobium sp.]